MLPFAAALKRKTNSSIRRGQVTKYSRSNAGSATSGKSAGQRRSTGRRKCPVPPPKAQRTNGSRTKMAIKTSSAKAKGRKLQQWVRDQILKLIPTLEPDDVKSTGMGQSGEDVQLSPAARKEMPLTFECKARKSIAVYGFYDQAKENAPKNVEPVVIIKADRKKPLAIVDAEFFLSKMVKK